MTANGHVTRNLLPRLAGLECRIKVSRRRYLALKTQRATWEAILGMTPDSQPEAQAIAAGAVAKATARLAMERATLRMLHRARTAARRLSPTARALYGIPRPGSLTRPKPRLPPAPPGPSPWEIPPKEAPHA